LAVYIVYVHLYFSVWMCVRVRVFERSFVQWRTEQICRPEGDLKCRTRYKYNVFNAYQMVTEFPSRKWNK